MIPQGAHPNAGPGTQREARGWGPASGAGSAWTLGPTEVPSAAMRAMVFGAGLGTRLRPLTELLPKPVVPFFGRPLAGWALDHLVAAGASSVVVNTHHLAERVEAALAEHVARAHPSIPLAFSREPGLLGTGGGLRRAWELEEERRGRMGEDEVLVAMNGDILFAPDLRAVVAEHRARGADATLVLRRTEDPFSLGAIEVDPEGRVVAMLAKSTTHPSGTAAMFTGVHVLSRRALARLPREGCVVRQGYRTWLAEGRVFGTLSDAAWLDLGTPRVYRDAHLEVLRGRRALPGLEADGSWVAPDATVSRGARLEETVLGPRSSVGARSLTRVVVWPGAHVDSDLSDAIVLPDGRVVLV
jgi:mannose-1-phosphate guanylyltransferase